jgi:Thiopurine S-methyltransferase (TPMT)
MDHVPERLSLFLRSLSSACNVLVPGCGEDFRTLEAFRRAGHRVTALDFSSTAIEAIRESLPEMSADIVVGDFFNYDFRVAPFDVVYERTFLCSLPPRLWKSYATRVRQLLKPKGALVGFFFYGEESDPPPYPLTESRTSEIFGSHFDLRRSEAVTDSLSIFGGMEKWQEWQLRKH